MEVRGSLTSLLILCKADVVLSGTRSVVLTFVLIL